MKLFQVVLASLASKSLICSTNIDVTWSAFQRTNNSSHQNIFICVVDDGSSDGGNAPAVKRQKLDDERKAVVEKAEHKHKDRMENLKWKAETIGIGFFASMKTVYPEQVPRLTFIFDGESVWDDVTAGSLGLEDGDQIDVRTDMVGD